MLGIHSYETSMFRDSQLRTWWLGKIEGTDHGATVLPDTGDSFVLILAQKGKGELKTDGKSAPLLAGYYYLISPYSRYRLMLPEGGSVLAFIFSSTDIELESIIRSIPPVGPCAAADQQGLEQWIQLAEKERQEPHPLMRYRIDSGFKSVLLSIAHAAWQGVMGGLEAQEGGEKHTRVSFPMAEYIRKHYSDKLTLNDMAKQFGFHPHYIIKMFNQRVGMSPIQYLQEIRLLKAMEFLEKTNMTVTEISESVGLTTSYFSRLFHERKGESPSQYRKKREKKYSMKTS